MARRALGRQFGWVWAAYVVSAYGSGLGFGAFGFIAIRVLHAGSFQVSALAAAGLAVGAAVAVPLGPWMEFRRKRPVMIAMDLIRFAAVMSIPAAFAFGWLSFAQLLVVSVIVANGRFESTMWTSVVVGPPLGGAAIGLFGPVTTVFADAVSYLLSAVGIICAGVNGEREPRPVRADAPRLKAGDLLDGWRHILGHPGLRPMFFNGLLVNGFIMATEPLMAVLMLGHLGFAPWQYGLAFAAPCVGGLIGSRLARPLAARFGRDSVLFSAGTLRACWIIGLAFVRPGVAGIVLVIVVQFGLVLCCGVYNPMLATYRLDQTEKDRVARTLSAWSISSSLTIAAFTALWGVLASLMSPRAGIAIAGALILATPVLLPRPRGPAGKVSLTPEPLA